MSFVLFLLYVATSYMFPGELWPVLAPYRITLGIGIVAVLFAGGRCFIRGRFPAGPQLYLLTAFAGVISISAVITDHWLGGVWANFVDFAPSFLMFLLALWNLDSFVKLRVLSTVVVLLSIGLAAQGIAAYHFGYKADQLLMTDVGDSDEDAVEDQFVRIRGLGVMNDPNDLALGLVTTLPLLALAWQRKRHFVNLVLVIVPLAIILYGIYLTRSRGALLSVLLVVLMGFSARLGRIQAAVLAGVLAVGSMALDATGGRGFSTNDESAEGRVAAWSEGLQMLKEQPLMGVGYHGFVDNNDKTAHNSFVLCFAELGLVGYFFWMALLVVTFLELMRIGRVSGDEREISTIVRWARALRLALFGLLVAAFFLSRTYVVTLYLVLGMAAALGALARTQDAEPAIPRPLRLTRLVSAWEFGSIAFVYLFVRVNALLVH